MLPLITKPFQNRVNSLMKEFAPMGVNSFLGGLTPVEGGKYENARVASPEKVPTHLKFLTVNKTLQLYQDHSGIFKFS